MSKNAEYIFLYLKEIGISPKYAKTRKCEIIMFYLFEITIFPSGYMEIIDFKDLDLFYSFIDVLELVSFLRNKF